MLAQLAVRTLTRAGALVTGPEEEGGQPYLDLERIGNPRALPVG